MPATALAMVLCAALLHALWNVAAKKAGGGTPFVMLCALMTALIWAPVGAWVGWSVVPTWGWQPWLMVLASGLVHLVYFRTLLRGYRESDLSVVYPVARGTGPLITFVFAVGLFGERPGVWALAGVLAVTFGVFLLAGGTGIWRRAGTAEGRERVRRGIAWGALTGVTIAGYTVIDAWSVTVLLISPILVDYFGNLLRVPFMLPGWWRDRAGHAVAWRRQWRHALVVAVLGPAAYVMVLYAMKLAPLSHVAPAREVSMLFAALLGGTLLGEGDRLLRLVGAACIAAGVAALALG